MLVFLVLAAFSLPTPASSSGVILGITGSRAQISALKAAGTPVEVAAGWVNWTQPSPRELLRDASAQGARPLVNWEPEGGEDRRVTVRGIAAGKLDRYIASWARAIGKHVGPVYIRMGHEMNGFWYPWSKSGPAAYRAMWRHVVSLFRSIAPNARFVWSPDGLIGETRRSWARGVRRWYPGRAFVDLVGMTTVAFKFSARYRVPYYFRRIDYLRRRYGKPVILPEMKVYAGGRYRWLRELRPALARRPWVRMVVWSETRSALQATGEVETGNMNWSLADDPRAREMLIRATGN